jgi:serine/threonine protein phosphatase PrpC
MEIQSWALSDVGRVRDHNEDNLLVEPALGLLVVADGMGGHAAGEVASQSAVTTLREFFLHNQPLLQNLRRKKKSQIEGKSWRLSSKRFKTPAPRSMTWVKKIRSDVVWAPRPASCYW